MQIFHSIEAPWGKGRQGVLPYMPYAGMCRWTGHAF